MQDRYNSLVRTLLRPLVGSLLLLAGSLLGAGCSFSSNDSDTTPTPGSMELRWRISAINKTCSEAGIRNVLVELLYEGGVALTDVRGCDEGSAEITGITPGTYSLRITGLDPQDRSIYRSASTSVTIRAGALTQVGWVQLDRMPATLEVFWVFANGRLCSFNKVREVEIWVWDFEEEKEVSSRQAYPCDYELGVVMIEVRPGTMDVFASALDEAKEPIFFAHERYTMEAEQVEEVELRLERCEEGSDEPGCRS